MRKENSDDFVTNFESAARPALLRSNSGASFTTWRTKTLPPKARTPRSLRFSFRSSTAIDNTESIIRKRIDQLGVAQPNVQKLQNGRILVELPGIDDRERARKHQKHGQLEFWETYFNDEVSTSRRCECRPGRIHEPRTVRGRCLPTPPCPKTSFAPRTPCSQCSKWNSAPLACGRLHHCQDTNRVNDLLRQPEARAALGNDLRLLKLKLATNVAQLFAIKDRKGAELSGKSTWTHGCPTTRLATLSSADHEQRRFPVRGAMTERCANENNRAVAVVLDNLVFSAPNVQTAITNGRSQISFGTGQSAEQKPAEAEDLAGLLKAGSLPAPARIVDEVSAGPQLGEENIKAGLSLFVALLVVLAYMIFTTAAQVWCRTWLDCQLVLPHRRPRPRAALTLSASRASC